MKKKIRHFVFVWYLHASKPAAALNSAGKNENCVPQGKSIATPLCVLAGRTHTHTAFAPIAEVGSSNFSGDENIVPRKANQSTRYALHMRTQQQLGAMLSPRL